MSNMASNNYIDKIKINFIDKNNVNISAWQLVLMQKYWLLLLHKATQQANKINTDTTWFFLIINNKSSLIRYSCWYLDG